MWVKVVSKTGQRLGLAMRDVDQATGACVCVFQTGGLALRGAHGQRLRSDRLHRPWLSAQARSPSQMMPAGEDQLPMQGGRPGAPGGASNPLAGPTGANQSALHGLSGIKVSGGRMVLC